MAEISIGNDRMVDEHHQGQERAGAVEREVAGSGLWRRPSFVTTAGRCCHGAPEG